MAGTKISQSFDINEEHLPWLKEMAEKYDLEDEQKALRALLDYAMEDGDKDVIFGEFRCLRCG